MDISESAMNLQACGVSNKITTTEYRKVIKPLLERRRRARINQCLTELKNLILDTVKHENLEPSKLEKADILELTVKHLQQLRRYQRGLNSHPVSPRPVTPTASTHDRYRAGFAECAREVSHYVITAPGMNHDIKQRLVSHLDRCLTSSSEMTSVSSSPMMSPVPSPNTPPPSPTPSDSSYLYSPSSSDAEDNTPISHFQQSTTAPLNLSAKITTSYSNIDLFEGHLQSPVLSSGHLTPVSPNGQCYYYSHESSLRPVAPWRPW
jgi:hypothetical protein